MNTTKLKSEVLQMSIYCDIILSILKEHEILSICKTTVFAYIINKMRYTRKKVFKANNSKDVVNKCLSLISGDFDNYCDTLPTILKSINLLIKNNKIKFRDGSLIYADNRVNCMLSSDGFINSAIKKSSLITDKQFMREVLHNV